MTASVNLTDEDIFTALRAFLIDILPAGDARFQGSISGTTLSVASVSAGTIELGDSIFGLDVASGTRVLSSIDSATFVVSISQSVENSFLSSGIAVVQGQVSRVPELKESDFVVMTPPRRQRIETNVDEYADVAFEGSVENMILTVSTVAFGVICAQAILFGANVSGTPVIVDQLSGTPGAAGTYQLSSDQGIITPQNFAAGQKIMTAGTEVIVQLDVHGPQGGNTAQIITTAFRDEYAATFIGAQNPAIAPLFADDARQVPFPNEEQQWEDRWIIEAHLQINPEVRIPQEFADQASVTLIETSTIPL